MEKTDDIRVWGIHAVDDQLFLEKNVLAIGWCEMGDLSPIAATREAFKERFSQVYPKAKKQAKANCAGMLYRFVHEIQVGDYVVYPSKFNREINIGVVESGYAYNPSDKVFVQQRKVKWLKHLPRTAFTQGALYEVGSFLTLFSIKNYADEFLSALDKSFVPHNVVSDEDEVVARTAEDIIESTKDYILKELSTHLKGYELEGFVADLLRAMGYRTKISSHGGDSGIDIQAYKDELPPRILVQVKSSDGDIKESTIQSLKGAMREGDYGLFVTLANYTKNAEQYLKSTPIIRGINGAELADLILKYYDGLSEKYKRIISLKMVYIPIVEKE
jgi:restriction system protein